MGARTMSYFVTGGCGFIGSHLVDRLMQAGRVTVYDNLSSGKESYVRRHYGDPRFTFVKADLLDQAALKKAMRASGADAVFHLAANPEIRIGETSPRVDFEQGTVATYHVLEAMRSRGVKNIVFSSSSTVFGEPRVRPTPEEYAPMTPISIYGASKMACEGLISAYCHMFGMRSWIFRFANIVGERGTHGILVDFMRKLKKNPGTLEVLGDGKQRKSYLLVEDCVDGMLFGFRRAKDRVNICNLGSVDDIRISEIARIVVSRLGLTKARIRYTGGRCGWRGDVPLMLLDTGRMKKLGWRSRHNSRQAVVKAIDDLARGRAGLSV